MQVYDLIKSQQEKLCNKIQAQGKKSAQDLKNLVKITDLVNGKLFQK